MLWYTSSSSGYSGYSPLGSAIMYHDYVLQFVNIVFTVAHTLHSESTEKTHSSRLAAVS